RQLSFHVSYSSYHFSRIFKSRTGFSPLYYVSFLCLHKAKDLLLNTDFNFRDIGLNIAQQSLRTFTIRFTHIVGITPSKFQKSYMQVSHHIHSLQKLSNWRENPSPSHQYATVEGTIQTAHPFNGFILIGLFSKPIPEEFPLYGTLLSSTGDFSF